MDELVDFALAVRGLRESLFDDQTALDTMLIESAVRESLLRDGGRVEHVFGAHAGLAQIDVAVVDEFPRATTDAHDLFGGVHRRRLARLDGAVLVHRDAPVARALVRRDRRMHPLEDAPVFHRPAFEHGRDVPPVEGQLVVGHHRCVAPCSRPAQAL